MAGHQQLPKGSVEFIEGMGLYFAQYDLPRIFGRLVGLLMLTERPLAHDEIAKLLGISRGSVSTNMRLAITLDLAERVAIPGDRRDFYRQTGDAWGQALDSKVAALAPLRNLAQRALQTLPETDLTARDRLDELLDFCAFFEEESDGLAARWHARRTAREKPTTQEHLVVPASVMEGDA